MSTASRYIYALSFSLAGAGFLLPLWPLCIVGVAIAALSGRWLFAALMGLLLDLGFGVGTGFIALLPLPFTMLALALGLVQIFAKRYFIDKTPPERI